MLESDLGNKLEKEENKNEFKTTLLKFILTYLGVRYILILYSLSYLRQKINVMLIFLQLTFKQKILKVFTEFLRGCLEAP